jgi:starch phosphorylase
MGAKTWSKSIQQHWPDLRFSAVTTRAEDSQYVFEAQVSFGGPFRQKMDRIQQPDASESYILYSSKVLANRPASDFTPRVIPSKTDVLVPLEANQILWQH